MKKIGLTQGYAALVDDADYEALNQYTWYVTKVLHGGHALYYAATFLEGAVVLMHHMIMDAEPGTIIAHLDVDGLNNQRHNLRECVWAEVMANRRKQAKKTSSQYKGVYWSRHREKWIAQVKSGGVAKNLGGFSSEIEAAKTYDEKARETWGEFARTNF